MRKGSPERGDMRVRGKAFPFEGKVARRAGRGPASQLNLRSDPLQSR